MKRTSLIALVLACGLLAAPASATLSPTEVAGGALSGIAVDGENLLVTDVFNKVIWRVTGDEAAVAAGRINMTDLAGEPIGLSVDGTIKDAFFSEPWAITPYLDGYAITDTASNKIRYMDALGVFTAAGSATAGDADGVGTKASFDGPTGLATGDNGEVYIADTGNGTIRILRQTGQVSTIIRSLVEPMGLCTRDGALYIAETGRNRILCYRNGAYTVVAGGNDQPANEDGYYEGGFRNGLAAETRFDHPQGLTVAADGTIYVADTGNGAIRAIRDGRVYTVAVADVTPEGLAQPRSLLVRDNLLYVTDMISESVTELDLSPVTYADVSDDAWYADVVAEATRRGLVLPAAVAEDGTKTFSPDALVSRAELVTMLASLHLYANGHDIPDGTGVFTDIPADAFYAPAARWALSHGFLTGYEDGTFRPDDAVTRQELATILHRYAKYIGADTADGDITLSDFSDGDTVDVYAKDAMTWAISTAILGGYEDGTLRPTGNATRAQSAKMLLAAMTAFEK